MLLDFYILFSMFFDVDWKTKKESCRVLQKNLKSDIAQSLIIYVYIIGK